MPCLTIRSILAALAAVLMFAAPVAAERLRLAGQLLDDAGQPMSGARFRLVLGSDPDPRAPQAGRWLTTDARGRFAWQGEVALRNRRIRLDNRLAWHPSRLLELGFAFDLLDRPALYWVEVDFTRHGPVRGIAAYVAGPGGRLDRALIFHNREHAWSLPDDPRGMRLTGIGADVLIDNHDTGEGELMLDLTVTRHRFQMR